MPKIEVRTVTDLGEVILGSKGIAEEPENSVARRSPGSQFTEDKPDDEDSDSDEEEEYNTADEPDKPPQRWENRDAPLLLYTYQVQGLSYRLSPRGTKDVSKKPFTDAVDGGAAHTWMPVLTISCQRFRLIMKWHAG